jgi:hypothetical protein
MIEFFIQLFDNQTFMPHGQCMLWYPGVLWLHVISDIIITLAYFFIPCAILYITRKRKYLLFQWVYVMFGAFIFLCGLTHLLSIIVLWYPIYRFEGVIKAITAGLSIATAFLIIPIIPQFLSVLEDSLHQKDSSEKESDRHEL